MTIEDAKNNKLFPSFLTDQEIIDICKSIGFVVNDLKSVIDVNKLKERIPTSPVYNSIKVKNEVSSMHNGVIQKYQDLIDNYKNMITNMSKMPDKFTNEIAAINSLIQTLSNERDTYANTIKGFTYANKNQYFQFDNNNLLIKNQNIINKSFENKILQNENKTQKDLNRLYREEKIMENRQANTKNPLNKLSNKIKIDRIQKRINRLRKKQGKLQSNQRMIVTGSTSVYISRMERRFDLYAREQQKINDVIEEKISTINEIDNLKRSKIEERKYIRELELDKMNQGLIGQMISNRDIKKSKKNIEQLKERIKRLNVKQGSVDLSNQFAYVFDRSYSM